VLPLVSLLLLLVAVQMASCDEVLVEVDHGRTPSLSLRTSSLLESPLKPSTTTTPSRRGLASARHGVTSGAGSSAIGATDDGLARASSSSFEEEGHLSLPRTKASRLMARAASKGSSSARRSSGRRLTQASGSSNSYVPQIAKLLASDGLTNNYFGNSVAVDGDTMVIGAYGKNLGRGSAYIYTRDIAGIWTQRAKLLASNSAINDLFGISVAVSGDTVVVGARYDDDNGSNSGSAYIFTRDVAGSLTASWTERQFLLASNGATNDYFGSSVAVDGDTVAVGAYLDDDMGADSGSAYIFTRDVAGSLTASWTERQFLMASDGAPNDHFGWSVAVSGDTVAVGAYGNGASTGAAYIFTRASAGSLTASWTERAKLLASDGAGDDQFGFSVAVDGDTVAVGAKYDDDNGTNSGSAYIFTRDVAGSLTATWTQRAKLLPSDGATSDYFGRSVAVSGDTVAVGALGDDDKASNSGSAYIFTRVGAGSLTASWAELQKLLASDGAADDNFGFSVAVDGDTVVVGARFDDDNGSNSGSAYVFALWLGHPCEAMGRMGFAV
jgi:hypothetical protein